MFLFLLVVMAGLGLLIVLNAHDLAWNEITSYSEEYHTTKWATQERGLIILGSIVFALSLLGVMQIFIFIFTTVPHSEQDTP